MGKRGLYNYLSTKSANIKTIPIMNFLQYADGLHDLNEIKRKIKEVLRRIKKFFNILLKNRLITI